jgi:hypothetical protein
MVPVAVAASLEELRPADPSAIADTIAHFALIWLNFVFIIFIKKFYFLHGNVSYFFIGLIENDSVKNNIHVF